jgi:lipid II:glycine glycyltransferase (peptidoglycan interpeptide bridge formation enzyme)
MTVGTAVLHGETVSMDLSLSRDAAYQVMRRDIRRPIQRAAELGVVATQDVAFDYFEAFVDLYRQTMERLSASSSYRFDLAYFEALREALGPRLSLWCVDIEGDVAAAGLFVETCGIIQYHLSAISDRHLGFAPNKALIADVRDWGATRGDRSLHLGGGVGGENDSLFHFKSGFSDLRHPFHTLRVVLDAAHYEQLVTEHDPSLDPTRLEGYFPLYRA